jgi:hypothetical protein
LGQVLPAASELSFHDIMSFQRGGEWEGLALVLTHGSIIPMEKPYDASWVTSGPKRRNAFLSLTFRRPCSDWRGNPKGIVTTWELLFIFYFSKNRRICNYCGFPFGYFIVLNIFMTIVYILVGLGIQ